MSGTGFAILLAAVALAGTGTEEEARSPLTLEEAIAAAHDANARLPVAALDVQIAQERRLEAEAERRVRLTMGGDLWYAPPDGYDEVVTNGGEERLQVIADKSLYEGGALVAGVREATARRAVAAARYRQAVRDVDYEVRVGFAEVLAAEADIAARRESLQRLSGYRSYLESRERAGQAVSAQVLRTTVQIASTRADLVAAEARRDGARMGLNHLMGRAPETPLVLAPLPPPRPPSVREGSLVAGSVPELAAARSEVNAAAAAVDVVRALRRPHVSLQADAGLWGSGTSYLVPPDFAATHPGADFGDRLRRDLGYSVTVSLSWPLTAFGVLRARIAEAEVALDQAGRSQVAVQEAVSLQQALARRAMEHAYRRYRELSGAAPTARDAYLEAESRYRGGTGSFLEVLDAFVAAGDVAVQTAAAELACRQAEAAALRWAGGP